MLTSDHILEKVHKELTSILKSNHNFKDFYERLFEFGTPYLVGGAIRDFSLNTIPKDLDLVINCGSKDLYEFLKDYNFNVNSFKGYKLKFDNIKVDVWSLENHWAFKKGIFKKSAKNIAKGAFFNLDSISLNLRNYKLDAENFIASYNSRILDINLQEQFAYKNPTPIANIKKAIKLSEKYNISVSKKVIDYCEYWYGYSKKNDPKIEYFIDTHYVKG